MKCYSTEKEQRGALRYFFSCSKGKKTMLLAIGLVVVISALAWHCGWHWQKSNHTMTNTSSLTKISAFWQLINTPIGQASKKQVEAAQRLVDANNNNYGALISLWLVPQSVNDNNFIAAEKQLKKALTQTSDINLQSLINLRLARVQLQQRNFDEALKTIKKIQYKGWKLLAADINGDANIINGDKKAARIAYEKALQCKVIQNLISIKLKNLFS